MTMIESWSIVLFIVYAFLSQYVFRFQRTSRGVSQELLGGQDAAVITLLTPSWMGALGWLSTGLLFAATILSWFAFGWLGAACVLIYGFVVAGLTDVVSPFPSYKHCFDVIESELRSRIDDPINEDLLNNVRKIRLRHNH